MILSTGDNFLTADYYMIQVYNGNITFVRANGGSQTSVFSTAYNATDHAYVRISFISGTAYFDTSPDGITWTNRASESTGITITTLFVYLRDYNTGTSVTHKFDNFVTDILI
jgi:hypothetical protein